MTGGKTPSTLYLLARSLWPSGISVALYFCASVVIIVLQLVLLSLRAGTTLPSVFDGEWSVAYTNHVVQPLERLFNSTTVNDALVVVLWGVAGLCLYTLAEYLLHLYRDWRHAEHDIEWNGGQVVYHPARRNFITVMLWRIGVLLLALLGFIVLQPVIQQAMGGDPRLVAGALPVGTSVRKIALSVAEWMLLAHCFVVLLRLFLMRTRLFGDPEIE